MASEGYKNSSNGSSTGLPLDEIRSNHTPTFDSNLKKIWWGGKWIDWRPCHTQFLWHGPPYYNFEGIIQSDILDDSEKGEFTRFLLTLKLWESTPGYKWMSACEIWQSSLTEGYSYADDLDDIFGYSWRKDLDYPDSYNFVFPAKLLIRYNTPKDDLPLSEERTFADPGALMDFENTLDQMFKEIDWQSVRLPSDQEILFDRKTTTSYDKVSDTTAPQWEFSLAYPQFETDELVGKRCKVQVFPGGVRDTVIADIRANHSIRWIERLARHILEYIPESADTLYSSTFLSRLENNVNIDGYHVLRDISKCGLTYNVKDLFPIVQKLLRKYKPDSRYNRFDIFKKLTYIDENGSHEAHRGYFLGMANHIVTLTNIAISRIARNMSYSRLPSKFVKCSSLTGNDDQNTVFFPKCKESLALANEYLNNEHELHASLGNKTNRKKSVVKAFGLFYENYSAPGWRGKEALVCNALACAYLSPDIRTAKMYISSQTDRFKSRWAFAELVKLARYWGPEFYDVNTELRVSNEIGGWLRTTSYGLSTALRDLDDIWPLWDHIIPFAYAVCKRRSGEPKPQYQTEATVFNHIYQGPAKKSDPRVQLLTLGREDVLTFYKKLTTYQRNFKRRMETSGIRKISYKTLSEIQRDILKNPWHCIPESLIAYQTWSSSDICRVSADTELLRWDNDPISSLLQGNLDEEDSVMTWDPLIPAFSRNYTLNTTLWNYRLCSQFSNSGILPILEYFYRNRVYPMPKSGVGRIRIAPYFCDREEVDRNLAPPGKKRHLERCRIVDSEPDQVELEISVPIDKTIEDVNKFAQEVFDEFARENHFRDNIPVVGSIITAADIEDTNEQELLDKLLNADDNQYDHRNREEAANDLLYGSDSDESLGLNFF
jgi:hypothetical protein